MSANIPDTAICQSPEGYLRPHTDPTDVYKIAFAILRHVQYVDNVAKPDDACDTSKQADAENSHDSDFSRRI